MTYGLSLLSNKSSYHSRPTLGLFWYKFIICWSFLCHLLIYVKCGWTCTKWSVRLIVHLSRFYLIIPGREQNRNKFSPTILLEFIKMYCFLWSWDSIGSAKIDHQNTQPEDIRWPTLVKPTGPTKACSLSITGRGSAVGWGQSRPLSKIVFG